MAEIKNLPPVPIQSPLTSESGQVNVVWAEWLRKLIPSSDRTAGYQILPGGLYLQWGTTASLNSGTTTSISLPIAFPTACLTVLLTPKNNSASATAATGHPGTGNYTVSAFDLYNRASVALVFNWVAVGY